LTLKHAISCNYRSVYEEIKEDAQIVWGFQRYQIVEDYMKRSVVVQPFSILSDIYIFLRWCFRCSSLSKEWMTIANVRKQDVLYLSTRFSLVLFFLFFRDMVYI